MAYYTNLFSPETYEAFSKSTRDVSGFRIRQQRSAERIQTGDKLICYMTKLSRWIGVLEVCSECTIDSTPIFYPEDDPFIVRLKVKPIVWLSKEYTIPIHEPHVWNQLSFTKDDHGSGWTGIVRRSLNQLSDEDGFFLEQLLVKQKNNNETYDFDEELYQKQVLSRIRRADKTVAVTVPQDDDNIIDESAIDPSVSIRESTKIQALLAEIGEKMGFNIWIPKHDRSSVLGQWKPDDGVLIDRLPLNYDETTLKTIEQIDVLWLKGRSIVRAFEVEHTTAVYSGILRMADLLALQPNMDIRLHIVAPDSRRDKVFNEIQRPVFSLLDRAPLFECYTFLSYNSIEHIKSLPHISHLSDSVLEEYSEDAE